MAYISASTVYQQQLDLGEIMACGIRSSDENTKEFQNLSDWTSYSYEKLLNKLSGYIENDEARIYTVASTRFDKSTNLIRPLHIATIV